jgi:hypothetical protein
MKHKDKNWDRFYLLNIQPYSFALANPHIPDGTKKRIREMIAYWETLYMEKGGKIDGEISGINWIITGTII